jgi:hypothetical protein
MGDGADLGIFASIYFQTLVFDSKLVDFKLGTAIAFQCGKEIRTRRAVGLVGS